MLACVSSPAFGQGPCELDRVNPSDATPQDLFGASIALGGDFVVVGAPGTERTGREFVPSYIFRLVSSGWVEEAILAPDDISPRAHFGRSVAISGDVAVVGAMTDGHTEPFEFDGPGSAYVYRFDGTKWTEEAKLVASDAAMGNFLGSSVAVSGNRIIVGASGYLRDDVSTGAAYVFEYDGTQWNETTKLTASDANSWDRFGHSVAIRGATVVVGSPAAGHLDPSVLDGSGAVYVFRFDGAQWIEEQILTIEELPPRAFLGSAVAIGGDVIVAGAVGHDVAGNGSGAAYAFGRGEAQWVTEGMLLGSDTTWGDRFGASVAIQNGLALVGAYNTLNGHGSAYVFQRNGVAWSQIASLSASDAGFGQSWFGFAVTLDGDLAAVGAKATDNAGTNTGSVYLYRILGGFDCNANSVNDSCEPDCNENNIPDDCDLAQGPSLDCNSNGIPDDCEVDCNLNTIPDDCDIQSGSSDDCNMNAVPDECDADCNENQVPDDCDLASGTSDDCNANGVPDDCEPDCNGNAIADGCDIASGISADCNHNEIPDDCESQQDCNGNGRQDICDIAGGESKDCNGSGVPDECEQDRFYSIDLPGLLGGYGGTFGDSRETAFDFYRKFGRVRAAWLRIVVSSLPVEAAGSLDGVWGPSLYVPADEQVCVPLAPTPSASDGTGLVRLVMTVLGIWDWPAGVTSATLFFDVVDLPSPTSVAEFARFQRCFSGERRQMDDRCLAVDYDQDADVDLADYSVFLAALAGP